MTETGKSKISKTLEDLASLFLILVWTLGFALSIFSILSIFNYREQKYKNSVYKEHIINEDIMPYYEENDLLSVQAYVIMDCEGGDGHCYQVEVIVYEFDTERARVDLWCCYISDYQCDSDYCATYYLEYLENEQ